MAIPTPNHEVQAARLRTVEQHIQCENAHDLDGVLATFGEQARYDEEAWDDRYEGRGQVRSYYRQLFEAAADLHIEVLRRHATGEAIIFEVLLTGTHTGAWRGLPATGRRFRLPLCAIYTFDEQHKLAGERIYYDRATVLRQLGVFREPDTLPGRVATLLNHPLTLLGAMLRPRRSAAVRPQSR